MYSGWPGDRVKAIFWTRPPSCPVPTQLAIVAGNKIIAGWHKNDKPAPVVDMLGLTESLNVFIGVPTDPYSDDPWIKYPHPLTYVSLLKSPFDLTPVENPIPGEEYLLFYLNFITMDYIEAIIPGDFVIAAREQDKINTAMGPRNISQSGFIYSRRAKQNEGFKIREGCG